MHVAVNSPITGKEAHLLYAIASADLIRYYADELQIDIRYILRDLPSIALYQCHDTGYRFFYPFNIDGDGQFYEKLEQIPWYYADWKWDYDVAKDFIPNQASVLDIGCGEGKFLRYLKEQKQCACVGLELNQMAQQLATQHQLQVYNEMVQDHAKQNKNCYDVVTFFQVLEHIADITSFVHAAIDVVKPGGYIIVAVPNNDPYYLKNDKDHVLNLPPHHMGWWNENSLRALGQQFHLQTIAVKKQPLQHYSAYAKALLKYRFKLPSTLTKLLAPMAKLFVYFNKQNINGASILIVYQKPKA
ncbi:MAG: class I SAM-dependent methyltransferase [Chitinophagaceae bacterium]|nr:class I SAM-dependent methyltransferase [Chitinophagaceae bacterium]